MDRVLIRAENLTRRARGPSAERGGGEGHSRGRALVEDVSLEAEAGRTLVVIGPNGAGKTTLLRLLLRLERPSTGFVRHAEGLRIGYVPQEVPRDRAFTMTAGRFLSLSARRERRRDGGSDGGARARAEAALAQTGLDGRAGAQIASLSGGEWRRLLLARALLREPRLLALDEPDAHLDLAGRARFYEDLESLRRERGFAVVLVSHALSLVMAKADHVVCLNGRVCCRGSHGEVEAHPGYRALFGLEAREGAALRPWPHRHGPGPEPGAAGRESGAQSGEERAA